jgi:hypothetical protein
LVSDEPCQWPKMEKLTINKNNNMPTMFLTTVTQIHPFTKKPGEEKKLLPRSRRTQGTVPSFSCLSHAIWTSRWNSLPHVKGRSSDGSIMWQGEMLQRRIWFLCPCKWNTQPTHMSTVATGTPSKKPNLTVLQPWSQHHQLQRILTKTRPCAWSHVQICLAIHRNCQETNVKSRCGTDALWDSGASSERQLERGNRDQGGHTTVGQGLHPAVTGRPDFEQATLKSYVVQRS